MICEFCGKDYLLNETWKSTRFCSKTCRAKNSNKGRVEKTKIHLNDLRRKLVSNPKLSPRE